MFYQTEAKVQGWRALAILADGGERLIYVGRSTTQVRGGYAGAFMELFDEEERAQVEAVELQCWNGAADRGHWVPKGNLPVPTSRPVKVVATEDEEEARVLPFRKPGATAEPKALPAAEEPVRKRLATTA